ncbi:MAG: PQQ-dependent sugar dehydrogenase [Litorilinea sp.]
MIALFVLAACGDAGSGQPAAPAPTDASPATDAVTDEPATDEPATDEPATDEPADQTDADQTDADQTDADQTDADQTDDEAEVVVVPTAEPSAEATLEPSAEPVTESAPAAPAQPQYTPDSHTLALMPVADGFAQPLYAGHAGDGSGRLFIVEKGGVIQILQDGGRQDAPFLDIRDRVGSSGFEQGLLGLAFAPNFTETGFFFVDYTDSAGNTVVSRFQVDPASPNQVDAATEFTVLQIEQPAANHNGGGLAFGPDGYLWIGTGDGGGSGDRFGNGQNAATLLGKMLRLDVTSDPSVPYVIPADNPWVEADWNGQDVRDEIWAIGLRNPWRYSFDRTTGDLWIADVGQNAIEAVHFTPAGHAGGINYGWPILEGSRCYADPNNCDPTGLDLPVLEYAHGQGDCSITGGYLYRGAQFADLQGAYVFGDYCSGNVWVGVPAEEGSVEGSAESWTSYHALAADIQLSSFGEDEAGELYATGLSNGTVYQVVLE